MIKRLMIIVLIISILIVFGTIADAEMTKEGKGEYRSAKSTVYTVLPVGKERVQMNYDQTGAVVIAPMDSPLYNATFWSIGSMHAIKGRFKGSGFILFTNSAEEKIYATAEFEGVLGGSYKCHLEFVEGTGSCSGIQGGVDFEGVPGLKPSKTGIGNGISVGTVNWKICQKTDLS